MFAAIMILVNKRFCGLLLYFERFERMFSRCILANFPVEAGQL